MSIIDDLSLGNPPDEVNVFIEIPKGSKNKYEFDKATGLITLDRVNYGPQVYPMDYGLLPQTHWHDGDSLDAVVINSSEPYYPGVIVPARPVGVVRMVDSGEKDEKLICVPVNDPRLAEIKNISDIAPHTLKELKEFFETYKNLTGKKVTVSGIDDRAAAIEVLNESIELYKKQKK
ncbi:inorganic diphosphatase [Patescibacteria group bacterium]|nr:inorganic diphosphatase [Patescibacteria group bacterium]